MARYLVVGLIMVGIVALAAGCVGGVVQGTLEGAVTVGAQNTPVQNAQVTVATTSGGTPIRTAVTGNDGRYRVTNLDRGTYWVTVTPQDQNLEPLTQRVTITAGGPTVLNFSFVAP